MKRKHGYIDLKEWECDACGKVVHYDYIDGLPGACPNCEAQILGCEGSCCTLATTRIVDTGDGNRVGLCDKCADDHIVCSKCGTAEPKRLAWGTVCRSCFSAAPARDRFALQMADLLHGRPDIGEALRSDILRHLDDVCAHYESLLSPAVPVRRVPENVGGDWRAAV